MELEDIMSAKHPVTLGNLYNLHNKTMQALMYEDYPKTYDGDERPLVSVKKKLDGHDDLERQCPHCACCA